MESQRDVFVTLNNLQTLFPDNRKLEIQNFRLRRKFRLQRTICLLLLVTLHDTKSYNSHGNICTSSGHFLQSGAQISASANNRESRRMEAIRLRGSAKSQSHCNTSFVGTRKCSGKIVPSALKLYPRHQAWKIVPSKNYTLAQTKKKTMVVT